MNRLQGKVAVVTGVSAPTSIGFGIAKRVAEEGSTVLIIDIQEAVHNRASELVAQGFTCQGYQEDLTNGKQVQKVFDVIKDNYERIDILINNAGKSVPPRPSFIDMSEDYFDTVFDRNFKTTFQCCKAVAPIMTNNKYGKIVNISSTTGPKVVYRYSAAYAAAKGAVLAFTKAIALELGMYNINVNAILPGLIDIGENRWTQENDTYRFGKIHRLLQWPIHTPGFPEDIADLAVFLSSDESRYITGAEIVIDGGASILEPAISPEDSDLFTDALKE